MTTTENNGVSPDGLGTISLPPFQSIILSECVYLGGHGLDLKIGQSTSLRFTHKEFLVSGSAPISYAQVTDVGISGPGSVTSGGGFIGGGFGVAGALEGMALAGILNSLTAKTKVHTFLSITTHVGEHHFHFGGMEPAALRIALAPVFSTLRRMRPEWMELQLEALRWNQAHGQITQDEYARYLCVLSHGFLGEPRPGSGVSETEVIATCEAQLKKLGYEVLRSQPNKWEIRGKGGVTHAHSTEELERRAKEIARWAAAT